MHICLVRSLLLSTYLPQLLTLQYSCSPSHSSAFHYTNNTTIPTPNHKAHQTFSFPAAPVAVGALTLVPTLPALPVVLVGLGTPVVTTTVTVCITVGYSRVQVVVASLNVVVAIVENSLSDVKVTLVAGTEILLGLSGFCFGALRIPPCGPPCSC